jgi:hypothetical protein
MARFRRNGWTNVLALVAAALFALQSLASAQAAPVALDIFGNPICITDNDGGHPAPSNGGGHLGMECCLLGCGAAVSTPASAPVAIAQAWPRESGAHFATATPVALTAPGHLPGNPRAPPLVA